MARVLVTGMSGAGKSTLLAELRTRGHLTVDTDDDGWVLPDGLWDEARMSRLLGEQSTVAVSGTVDNQVRFYDRFDHVVLLSAPLDVLLQRVASRIDNPYGRTPAQQAEIRRYVIQIEPLLRKGASVELDGRLPVQVLGDIVGRLLGPSS
jgi:shikimate kinase